MMPPKFDGLFMFIMFSLSYLLDVNPQFCQTHPISHQGNSAGYPRGIPEISCDASKLSGHVAPWWLLLHCPWTA